MRRVLLGLSLFAGVPAVHAAALTPDQRAEVVQILRDTLRTDPSILRDAVGALQEDEAAKQEATADAAITAEHAAIFANPADPVEGNPAGNVTVVEFYDPRCPYCRQMQPVLAAMLRANPQVKLIYKDIPILGPDSVLDLRALLAAQRQGGYARLQADVMSSSAHLTEASLQAAAEHDGMDGAQLARDMADPAIQQRLDANLHLASVLHIEGTPALIIGNRMFPGAIGAAELQQAVAEARGK